MDRDKNAKLNDVKVISKVIERSKDVPIENLQNFILYSINVFPRCLNKDNYNCFDSNY